MTRVRRETPNTRPVPEWVSGLAWVLDESIPLPAGRRVGVDGVVSFIPGIGDAAGLVASMVVVLAGIGAGASVPTVALMMVNVGIDTLIGAIPFLGAIFDLGFKASSRNMGLIERDLADRASAKRSAIRTFVIAAVVIFIAAILFVVAIVAGIYLFARLLARWF